MIKLISALSILVLSVVALTACGGSDSVLQEYKQDSQAQEQPFIEQAQSDEPSAFLGQASSTVDSFTGDRITVIEGKSVSNASSSTIALACAGETPYVLMPTAVRSAGPIELSYITPSTVSAPNELSAHLIPVDIRAGGSGQRLGIAWHWGRINSNGGQWRAPVDQLAQAIIDEGEVQIRFLGSSVADLHVEFGKVEDSEHWQHLENCGQTGGTFFGTSLSASDVGSPGITHSFIVLPSTSNVYDRALILTCLRNSLRILSPSISRADFEENRNDQFNRPNVFGVIYFTISEDVASDTYALRQFSTLEEAQGESLRVVLPWNWRRAHEDMHVETDKLVRSIIHDGYVGVAFRLGEWSASEVYIVGDLSSAEHWPLLEQCGK